MDRYEDMKPRPEERESKQFAQMLLRLRLKGVMAVSRKDDGCPTLEYDYLKKVANEFYGDEENHAALKDELIATCEFIEMNPDEANDLIYNGRDPEARQLADWWDTIKSENAARIAQETHRQENKRWLGIALSSMPVDVANTVTLKDGDNEVPAGDFIKNYLESNMSEMLDLLEES